MAERTQEAVEQFRPKMLIIQNIESLARSVGVITGPKTKGRKPAKCKKVKD